MTRSRWLLFGVFAGLVLVALPSEASKRLAPAGGLERDGAAPTGAVYAPSYVAQHLRPLATADSAFIQQQLWLEVSRQSTIGLALRAPRHALRARSTPAVPNVPVRAHATREDETLSWPARLADPLLFRISLAVGWSRWRRYCAAAVSSEGHPDSPARRVRRASSAGRGPRDQAMPVRSVAEAVNAWAPYPGPAVECWGLEQQQGGTARRTYAYWLWRIPDLCRWHARGPPVSI
jgi:hypothetical protein